MLLDPNFDFDSEDRTRSAYRDEDGFYDEVDTDDDVSLIDLMPEDYARAHATV